MVFELEGVFSVFVKKLGNINRRLRNLKYYCNNLNCFAVVVLARQRARILACTADLKVSFFEDLKIID